MFYSAKYVLVLKTSYKFYLQQISSFTIYHTNYKLASFLGLVHLLSLEGKLQTRAVWKTFLIQPKLIFFYFAENLGIAYTK